MDRLYGEFVQPGDLVFDVGAHVGDRIAAFRRLRREGGRGRAAAGAGVHAEDALRPRRATSRSRPRRSAASAGTIAMMINVDNPTVSTASDAFVDAARGAPGWEGQVWEKSIDGADDDARRADRGARRAGLHQDRRGGLRGGGAGGADAAGAGAVVRVHHHPARGGARLHRALRGARICALQRGAGREPGARRLALGRADIVRWLDELPHEANSGDIYARLA